MNKTLTATLLCALATPSLAGGPVIEEEAVEVVPARPASSVNPLLLPLLAIVVVALVVNSNDEEECLGSVCP